LHDDYIGRQLSAATRTSPAAQALQVLQNPTASTTIQQDNEAPLQPKTVANNVLNAMLDGNRFVNPFSTPSTNVAESSSSSKDEAPKEIKTFLEKIIVLLQASVIIVRIDNGTEFKNQVLKEYFDSVGISHQASSIRTPQQNGVVEHKNRRLKQLPLRGHTPKLFHHH
ncbi:retrovirus-related pol polyprotein from transposon TNT 1-94, partial [Tanacetum coccineum]